MKTVQSITKKLFSQLETEKREDKPYASFKLEAIRSNNKYHTALSDEIIHELMIGDRFMYNTIYDFLNYILESEIEEIEDLREIISNFEEANTPVYTSDLTSWLSESDYHIAYLERAVTELNATTGFDILTSAYCIATAEIAETVITIIEELIEE